MPPRKPKPQPNPNQDLIMPPSTPLPTPSLNSTELRMSYRIARGEQGVLTFEPYKTLLLPYWRFKSVPIAQSSLRALQSAFDSYVSRGDFVGADMSRKFIQMGMTRARRYANHKGGKKYDRSEREVKRDGGGRVELEKSKRHEGMEEKAEASEVFKKGWEGCRVDEGYLELKKEFQREQRDWDRVRGKGGGKEKLVNGGGGEEVEVKNEKAVKEEQEEDMKFKEESDEG